MLRLIVVVVILTSIISESKIKHQSDVDVDNGDDIDDAVTYRGYRILEVSPTNLDQIEFLQRLQREDEQLDFWSDPTRPGQSLSLMVPPGHHVTVRRQLLSRNIRNIITNNDVQSLLDQNNAMRKRRMKDGFELDDFNRIEDIYEWLDEMSRKCPEGFHCQVYSIGITYEGRPIKVFKMTKPSETNRKALWIDAAIHAREWLSTATALKILNHVVVNQDRKVKRLRSRYDWYIAPVLNPDGYVYTHKKGRLWRKNRSPNSGSRCNGTDLNRNFDYNWGTIGVSTNPCNIVYCGKGPASEVETLSIQNETLRLADTLLATVTLHSYGNMWLFPYGNLDDFGSCVKSKYHDDMMDVANVAADAVQSTYGTQWTRGTSCSVIYPTSGSSMDYAQATADIRYPYCMELRGSSFISSQTEIQPAFNETWNGIEAMIKRISTKLNSKRNRKYSVKHQ